MAPSSSACSAAALSLPAGPCGITDSARHEQRSAGAPAAAGTGRSRRRSPRSRRTPCSRAYPASGSASLPAIPPQRLVFPMVTAPGQPRPGAPARPIPAPGPAALPGGPGRARSASPRPPGRRRTPRPRPRHQRQVPGQRGDHVPRPRSGSGGIGAPCQDCSWRVSPILPPHPACGSHRTGRSMCLGRWISRMARLMAGGRGWGSASRGSGSGLPARSPRR